MATIEVTVCDRCMTVGKETHQYEITGHGKTAKVALCDDDAAPLLEYLEGTSVPQQLAQARLAAPKRRAPRSNRVTTLADIEAQKKATKMAPPARGVSSS